MTDWPLLCDELRAWEAEEARLALRLREAVRDAMDVLNSFGWTWRGPQLMVLLSSRQVTMIPCEWHRGDYCVKLPTWRAVLDWAEAGCSAKS